MLSAKIPSNEFDRQEAVNNYHLLDTLAEKEYDDLTELAAQITDSPVSLITLVDRGRNWFKSALGTKKKEDPRDRSFCGHAINSPKKPFIIENTLDDERFFDNPLVTGESKIRFYAGIPIVNFEGFALGTLCIMDQKTKKLSVSQIETLQKLANQAFYLMEHHRKAKQLNSLNNELIEANKNLESFAQLAANDLKSPVSSIQDLIKQYQKKYTNDLNDKQLEILKHIHASSTELKQLIDGTLNHSKSNEILANKKIEMQFYEVVEFARVLVDAKNKHKFIYEKDFQLIRSNEVALKRILINIFTNSIKHSNKEKAFITIDFNSTADWYTIKISDNGPGIPDKYQADVFKLFERGQSNSPKINGVGIGLATVKKLVTGMNGTIQLKNGETEGVCFIIKLPRYTP